MPRLTRSIVIWKRPDTPLDMHRSNTMVPTRRIDWLPMNWNGAGTRRLERVRDLELRIEHQRSALEESPAVTLEEFMNLADDLETVWNNPGTDAGLKKRIVRTLIHEVIADIDYEASEVVLTIHWKGGVHTELRVPRRKRGSASCTHPRYHRRRQSSDSRIRLTE